jgi:hypothetical protein
MPREYEAADAIDKANMQANLEYACDLQGTEIAAEDKANHVRAWVDAYKGEVGEEQARADVEEIKPKLLENVAKTGRSADDAMLKDVLSAIDDISPISKEEMQTASKSAGCEMDARIRLTTQLGEVKMEKAKESAAGIGEELKGAGVTASGEKPDTPAPSIAQSQESGRGA